PDAVARTAHSRPTRARRRRAAGRGAPPALREPATATPRRPWWERAATPTRRGRAPNRPTEESGATGDRPTPATARDRWAAPTPTLAARRHRRRRAPPRRRTPRATTAPLPGRRRAAATARSP